MEDVDVMKLLDRCHMPALFISSKQDTLINPKHTEKIFQKYTGPKKLIYVKGEHNDAREKEILYDIVEYLIKNFSSSKPNKKKIFAEKKEKTQDLY